MTLIQAFLFGSLINGSIAKEAESRVGSNFRPGSSAMCAAFVADVVKDAGKKPPSNPNLARNWLRWGKTVSINNIQRGDIVVCWRGSKYSSKGHILIYVGNGTCVHRSTRSKPINKTPLSLYKSKILSIRRCSQ